MGDAKSAATEVFRVRGREVLSVGKVAVSVAAGAHPPCGWILFRSRLDGGDLCSTRPSAKPVAAIPTVLTAHSWTRSGQLVTKNHSVFTKGHQAFLCEKKERENSQLRHAPFSWGAGNSIKHHEA